MIGCPKSELAGKSLEVPVLLRLEVCPRAQPAPQQGEIGADLIPPGCKAEPQRKTVATSGKMMR